MAQLISIVLILVLMEDALVPNRKKQHTSYHASKS